MEEGKKREEVGDELFTKRFGRPDAGQPVGQRRKLVERVSEVKWMEVGVGVGVVSREGDGVVVVLGSFHIHACINACL